MKKRNFIATDLVQGMRLDKFLAKQCTDTSRSYIQKLIGDQLVTVNGEIEKGSYKIKFNDQVKLEIPEVKDAKIAPFELKLDILFEDEDIIVVNKPAGLVVHPAPGNWNDTPVNALLAYTDDLSGINGVRRPGIVHRLDKDTSGALIVAKNDRSHRQLIKQFKNRETKKIYQTVVKGNLIHDKGIIDAPIGRDSRERKKMAVIKKNSKKAVSHFQVLERFKEHSYLQVKLETGRTHQIRVHLAYIGHPVLGDNKYGKRKKNDYLNVKRQLLHAYLLGFKHPQKDKWLEIIAPLPADFQGALEILRSNLCCNS